MSEIIPAGPTLGWLDMLKEEVYAEDGEGVRTPVYVQGLRTGSPEAIARWNELAFGPQS